MGREKSETYVCDKCGDKCADPNYEQMKKWWELTTRMGESSNPSWLLCAACIELFKKWVAMPIEELKMVGGGGPYR